MSAKKPALPQGQLFDVGEAPPSSTGEKPDVADRQETKSNVPPAGSIFARVVFNRPMKDAFSYIVPSDWTDHLLIGKRVLAPLGRGNQAAVGYCIGVSDEPGTSHQLKTLIKILDDAPLLLPSMLRLTRWMADYYCCSWGQVLEAVLPAAVKHEAGARWALLYRPVEKAQRPDAKLTSKQRRAFDALVDLNAPSTLTQITSQARVGESCVRALVSKGWVTKKRQRVRFQPPALPPAPRQEPRVLNEFQQSAVDEICAAQDSAQPAGFLLHGVTGSGKTEVYLQAIAHAVAQGREAIVLVPEISLTPQTIERFRQRFDHVAVLHSHLSDLDRHAHWRRIVDGNIQVVVGARSAIFAPCKRLGLIVIDEEHETTFKQETTPRYHARDVAWQRAQLEKIPLILGSATPSLETWRRAQQRQFRKLSLPHRVGDAPMPRVQRIDLRGDFTRGPIRALSRPLVNQMSQTLQQGGQVLLLLNRRGFSTTIVCPSCGAVVQCHHCDISLTFHHQHKHLLCHQCGSEYDLPLSCPECQAPTIRYAGTGTERLESEVSSRFPDFTVARMDSDTMRSGKHYERVLGEFRDGKTDILLGTQMIAKGLDFPNVRLVGVISADTAMHLPDFRAGERTFQLIAQVAGRAGRGEQPGLVLVQTFNPDDPVIQLACRHDFLHFAQRELPQRQQFGYPPFSQLIRVIVRSQDLPRAEQTARNMAMVFQEHRKEISNLTLLGPAPAPVAKLRGYHRFHFQFHAPVPELDQPVLGPWIEKILQGLKIPHDVEYAIDIDPTSMY